MINDEEEENKNVRNNHQISHFGENVVSLSKKLETWLLMYYYVEFLNINDLGILLSMISNMTHWDSGKVNPE